MKNPLALIVAVLAIIIDQLTKLIFTFVDKGYSFPVWKGVFHLTVVHNYGAGFGILQGQRVFFILFSFAVLIFFFAKWDSLPGKKSFLIPLGLLLGGILGNLIDRLFRGYVIDFIDFQIWPVFNLADSAITIAIVWMILSSWSGKSNKAADKGKRPGTTGAA